MKKSVSAFAPASIGNLSVGFDLLGLAVQSDDMRLGDVVTIEENDQFEFHVIGDFAHVLPDNDKDNLVLKAYKLFTEKVPVAANENIKITLEKNLPICSGLGSSASSVVATLVALDSYFACSGCSALLLELMGKCEAGASGSLHYDNIAPSYLGGLQLCSVNSPVTHELPWPKDWKLILAYQDIDIPTAMARNILPESYTKQTTIQQMQYVAKFVHALHASDQQLAADSIIEKRALRHWPMLIIKELKYSSYALF